MFHKFGSQPLDSRGRCSVLLASVGVEIAYREEGATLSRGTPQPASLRLFGLLYLVPYYLPCWAVA